MGQAVIELKLVYLMHTLLYVTLSHLRSKEINGINKPCIPHSNDTTEYKPVCIQM